MSFAIRVALALVVVTSYSSLSFAQKPGVEVWMKGSDIETPKHTATRALRDRVEAAVDRSTDLKLSAAGVGQVRIEIPDDVIVAREGDVAYVLFVANVSVSKAQATEVSGYCRYDDLAKCAEKILAAIRSIPRTTH